MTHPPALAVGSVNVLIEKNGGEDGKMLIAIIAVKR